MNLKKEEVKNYIPHCILHINEQIDECDTLMTIMNHAFDWANRMGLEGKRVGSLVLEKPRPDHPFAISSRLFCEIECTEKERTEWEKNQKKQLHQAIHDALNN